MKTHGEIRIDGDTFVIRCDPHVAIKLKRLFPRAAPWRTGELAITATPTTAADIEWVLLRYPMYVEEFCAQVIGELAADFHSTEADIDDLLTGGSPPRLALEPARPLREYQRIAAAMMARTRRMLLGDDVGLGKTASALGLLAEPDTLPALVVTLTHLPRQWQREMAEVWPQYTSAILTKGTPYDLTIRSTGQQPDVIFTNYHKLAGWAPALAGKVHTVIFDECQELRRTGSDKYNAAGRIADAANYVVGLSATPIYNYGDEMHAVLSVIAPDHLGTSGEFTREWCSGSRMVADPAALGTYLRDAGAMLRRTREDVGRELPEVERVHHVVDLDPRVFSDTVGDEGARLANLILHGERQEAWQASGDLDWRLRHATGVAKAKYVAEFVKLIAESEPVVLFGWHRDVYAIWERELADLNPVFYTGSESTNQKEAAKEKFQSGEARVLVMSLRAGAGLDGLQDISKVCVFGELDWSPGMHTQAIGRLHRDGQEGNVVAYFLVADEGSDPVVAEVLGIKRAQQDPLFDPSKPMTQMESIDPDRIKRLAEDYLRRHRGHGEGTLPLS